MKGQFKGFVIGLLIGIFVLSGIAAIAEDGLRTLENVRMDGIRIVIDGKEFTCTDANGAVVQPMIYNGTTYIPVRAVSSAFGKAVFWDGEEQTVYLGDMDGKLVNPTATFEDLDNIAYNSFRFDVAKNIMDVEKRFYDKAYYCSYIPSDNNCCEFLLGRKYSKFKATLFVRNASSWDGTGTITIIGDEKVLYTSPELTKISEAIDIEVDVSDVNDFKILFSDDEKIYITHEGFYQ